MLSCVMVWYRMAAQDMLGRARLRAHGVAEPAAVKRGACAGTACIS